MFLTIQHLQDMGGSCKLNSHTYTSYTAYWQKEGFLPCSTVCLESWAPEKWLGTHPDKRDMAKARIPQKHLPQYTLPASKPTTAPNEKQAIQTPPSFTEKARKRTTPHSRLQQSWVSPVSSPTATNIGLAATRLCLSQTARDTFCIHSGWRGNRKETIPGHRPLTLKVEWKAEGRSTPQEQLCLCCSPQWPQQVPHSDPFPIQILGTLDLPNVEVE